MLPSEPILPRDVPTMKTATFQRFRRLAGPVLLAFVLLSPSLRGEDADVAQLLDRARAFIGGDAALDAVKSLHYIGTVSAQDGKKHKIDIIVRLPLQQRVTETTDEVRVITVLDNYDGWRRIEQLNRTDPARVAMLSAPDVRQLRANTWQNIYFYRHIDVVGGKIAIEGDADIDGVNCVKTTFTHTGGIKFTRYFEKTTGRLVLTQTNEGAESRESGEFMVAGIRFPKQLTTTLEDKTSTVVFDDIRVNEEFDESLFIRPMPRFSFDPKPDEPKPDATPAPATELAPTAPATDAPPNPPPAARPPAPSAPDAPPPTPATAPTTPPTP